MHNRKENYTWVGCIKHLKIGLFANNKKKSLFETQRENHQ